MGHPIEGLCASSFGALRIALASPAFRPCVDVRSRPQGRSRCRDRVARFSYLFPSMACLPLAEVCPGGRSLVQRRGTISSRERCSGAFWLPLYRVYALVSLEARFPLRSSDVPCPQLLSVPGVKLPVTSSSVLISGREASSKIEYRE
jgi:hypothetical protein